MRKAIFAYFIISIVFLLAFAIGTTFSQEEVLEHSVSGNIISTDLNPDKPAITVEYSTSDDYGQSTIKNITLRIKPDSQILDAKGKQKKIADLKVDDTVTVTYENKFTATRTKGRTLSAPLWHDVHKITITKTKEDADKLEKPAADESGQLPDTGY